MTRATRLLALVQALRRRRRPVSAAILAEELGVSPRTLYRDVATLQGQGAPISGAAGVGYVLEAGFFLPPLMFTDDEIDAVVLGLRLVGARSDPDLAVAAEHAAAKIAAMLPPAKEDMALTSGLLAAPDTVEDRSVLATIRQAIRAERKLQLRYNDKTGAATNRVVWPVAVGFFTGSEVLAAWCELRADYRHFRLDRIAAAEALEARLPRRHRILLAEWRQQEFDGDG